MTVLAPLLRLATQCQKKHSNPQPTVSIAARAMPITGSINSSPESVFAKSFILSDRSATALALCQRMSTEIQKQAAETRNVTPGDSSNHLFLLNRDAARIVSNGGEAQPSAKKGSIGVLTANVASVAGGRNCWVSTDSTRLVRGSGCCQAVYLFRS